MPFQYPTPIDDTYDYLPIAGRDIEPGTDVLALWVVQGTVTSVIPPADPEDPQSNWTYLMTVTDPDGTTSFGVAWYPAVPESQADSWWARVADWRRVAKPQDGATSAGPDGSEWIYPAGEDGKVVCFESGSTFHRGDRQYLGKLTTDPKDLWICDDPTFDWLPVSAGGDVSVGDTITFLRTSAGVVDHSTQSGTDYYRRTQFYNADTTETFGWWDEILQPGALLALTNIWVWFERQAKPADLARFRGQDGSRWIYTGGQYFCWGSGSRYRTGSIYPRGDIAGGLIPIT